MGRPPGWVTQKTGRAPMPSPGRPGVSSREQRCRFWVLIAKGLSSEQAAESVGVSAPVGSRWFRHAGGMTPMSLVPVSGRYLSFAEREEIAVFKLRPRALGFVRSPASSAGILQLSLVSCAVMPLHAAGGWTTGLRLPSGTANCAPGGRSLAGSRETTGCESMSNSGCQVLSHGLMALRYPGQQYAGSAAVTGRARTGVGPWLGVLSRSPAGCVSISRMMSR